jgi:hypothetical protein
VPVEPDPLPRALSVVLSEIVQGAGEPCWLLNPGDPGLLRTLDGLSAAAASAPGRDGGPSIAAHVDHLCYGLELLNRYARGAPDPFSGADYAASWRRTAVSEIAWAALRRRLHDESGAWMATVRALRSPSEFELTGVIASLAHLAYHLGAIRQIDRALRGPAARD